MPFEQLRQCSTHGRHVFVSEVGPQRAVDAPTRGHSGAADVVCLGRETESLGTTVGRVRDALDVAETLHLVTREETFIVLSGAITARFAEHDETAETGDALIIPADTAFSLVARGVPAEAICVLPVGGQAVTADGVFTPPWAK